MAGHRRRPQLATKSAISVNEVISTKLEAHRQAEAQQFAHRRPARRLPVGEGFEAGQRGRLGDPRGRQPQPTQFTKALESPQPSAPAVR